MLSRHLILVPPAFTKYVEQVSEEDLVAALIKSHRQFRKQLKKIPRKKALKAYAEGKWTLKEMLQHVIDAERVFLYRAVSFARKDGNQLPGFDENYWAANSLANDREWNEMIKEFDLVRQSAILFFDSLTDDQLQHSGIASNNEINVLGQGFVCAGHVNHHLQIIQERYLPALKKSKGLKKKKAEVETEVE